MIPFLVVSVRIEWKSIFMQSGPIPSPSSVTKNNQRVLSGERQPFPQASFLQFFCQAYGTALPKRGTGR